MFFLLNHCNFTVISVIKRTQGNKINWKIVPRLKYKEKFCSYLFCCVRYCAFLKLFTKDKFIVFTCKAKLFAFAGFVHLLLHDFSGILGNLERKKLQANEELIQFTCQLLWKVYSGLFCVRTSHRKGEFPRDYLINVAVCGKN